MLVEPERSPPTGGGFVVPVRRGAPIGDPVGPERAPDPVEGIGPLTAPVPIGAVFGADDGEPGIPVDGASFDREAPPADDPSFERAAATGGGTVRVDDASGPGGAGVTFNRVDDASLTSVDGRAPTPNSDGPEPGIRGVYAAAAGCVSVETGEAATSVERLSANGDPAGIAATSVARPSANGFVPGSGSISGFVPGSCGPLDGLVGSCGPAEGLAGGRCASIIGRVAGPDGGPNDGVVGDADGAGSSQPSLIDEARFARSCDATGLGARGDEPTIGGDGARGAAAFDADACGADACGADA